MHISEDVDQTIDLGTHAMFISAVKDMQTFGK